MANPTFQALQIQGVDMAALMAGFDQLLTDRLNGLTAAMKQPDPDRYLTRDEVADFFKITLPTLHSWINAGILKAYKIGNKTRFLYSEVKDTPKPSRRLRNTKSVSGNV